MFRFFTTSLAVALLLGGLAASVEAQVRKRSFRGLQRPLAQSGQAVLQTGSTTGMTIGGKGQVVARLPDLQITRVTPDQDGRPPEKITVVNGGGLPAASYDLRMTVLNAFGQTIYQVEIPRPYSLPAGAARTFRLPNLGDGASWSLRLDPNNRVREANERNNRWWNDRER